MRLYIFDPKVDLVQFRLCNMEKNRFMNEKHHVKCKKKKSMANKNILF